MSIGISPNVLAVYDVFLRPILTSLNDRSFQNNKFSNNLSRKN